MFFESQNKSKANKFFIIILKLIKNDNSCCCNNVQKIKLLKKIFFYFRISHFGLDLSLRIHYEKNIKNTYI